VPRPPVFFYIFFLGILGFPAKTFRGFFRTANPPLRIPGAPRRDFGFYFSTRNFSRGFDDFFDRKAREVLGWKPQFPEIEEIIESAWAWHEANPNGYEN
jgi:hypothetical protein